MQGIPGDAKTVTDLYRLYDSAGRLLYVGVSLNAARRLGEHRAKCWWSEVRRIDVERHDTPRAALAAELQAIRSESPMHNVAGAPQVPSEGVSTADYQREWRARHGAKTGKPGRPEKPAPPCGTLPAYYRHKRRGEEIDVACKAAWADYHRERRKNP